MLIFLIRNDAAVSVGDEGIPTPKEREKSKVFVNFINILFAIVLGQSFLLITLPTEQGCFKELIMNPAANFVPIFTLFLSYTLVISSFVGYNVSTNDFPIRYTWRFVIDIILLFMYFAFFTTTTDFGLVLTLYTVIFFFYSVWNIVRYYEYKSLLGVREQLLRRTKYCFVFFAFFLFALFVFNIFGNEFLTGMITSLILVVFVLYRINKRPERKPESPNPN